MPEQIIEKCEGCHVDYPVDILAFETLEVNECLKIWLCPECFEMAMKEAK